MNIYFKKLIINLCSVAVFLYKQGREGAGGRDIKCGSGLRTHAHTCTLDTRIHAYTVYRNTH